MVPPERPDADDGRFQRAIFGHSAAKKHGQTPEGDWLTSLGVIKAWGRANHH
jgi:hypothetical protein